MASDQGVFFRIQLGLVAPASLPPLCFFCSPKLPLFSHISVDEVSP